MRILITIEYDGTDFCGWQIQPDKRTVQGEVTSVLENLFGQPISLHGSGRTDSGVHALSQKAHFDLERPSAVPVEKIPYAANTKLPADVCVKKAELVEDDFEAQYSAKKKTYRYSFYFSGINRPLSDRFATQIPYSEDRFDINFARKALEKLVGTHDFVAFSSTGSTVKTTERTIYDATLVRNENGIYDLTVTGNGFLYNMVRIIAGTIAEIGLSQRPLSDVDDALLTGDRLKCGKTFPPRGLTLINVEYED